MATDNNVTGLAVNVIHHAPCGLLAKIPDDSVDVIITSPPYNLSYRAQRNKKHNMSGYGDFTDHLPPEQYAAEQISFLNACSRVLKANGSLFYNHKERQVDGVAVSPFAWVLQSQCQLVQTIIWDRGSTHNVDPVRLYPAEEYIFHLRKPGGQPRFNKHCAKWTKIWRIPFHETRENPHPAPFSEEVPFRCLTMADVPSGGVVLDPYCGSGTSLAVAVLMGCHYVGYEMKDEYIRMAEGRIAQAQAQLAISGPLRDPGRPTGRHRQLVDLFGEAVDAIGERGIGARNE